MVQGSKFKAQEVNRNIPTDNVCAIYVPKKNKVKMKDNEQQVYICKKCGLVINKGDVENLS